MRNQSFERSMQSAINQESLSNFDFSNLSHFQLENSSNEIWYKGDKPIKKRASFCIPNKKPNNLFFKMEGIKYHFK